MATLTMSLNRLSQVIYRLRSKMILDNGRDFVPLSTSHNASHSPYDRNISKVH